MKVFKVIACILAFVALYAGFTLLMGWGLDVILGFFNVDLMLWQCVLIVGFFNLLFGSKVA